MNKVCPLFPVLLLVLLALRSEAQISIGMSAGINLSFWNLEYLPERYQYQYRVRGYAHAAIYVDWPLSPVVALRTEIGGSNWRNHSPSSYIDLFGNLIRGYSEQHFEAWTGACLLRIRPFQGRWFFVTAGPAWSYLVSAQGLVYYPGGQLGARVLRDLDFNQLPYRRWHYQVALGMGARLPLGQQGRILLEIRLLRGVNTFSKDFYYDASLNVLNFTAGYAWQFPKKRKTALLPATTAHPPTNQP